MIGRSYGAWRYLLPQCFEQIDAQIAAAIENRGGRVNSNESNGLALEILAPVISKC
jgi:hypothetical protein